MPPRSRGLRLGLRPRPPLALLAVATALLGAALVLAAAPPARAQCVQLDRSVTCTGTDPDGFAAAGGENGLLLTVDPGATVENGGSGAAIQLNLDSQVRNDGEVTASGTDPVGIEIGSRTLPETRVAVGAGGSVTVSGDGGIGISAGNGVQVDNEGTISVAGDDAVGMQMGTNGELTQDADLSIDGANVIGIDARERQGATRRADAQLILTGSTAVTGQDATGVQTGAGRTTVLQGGELSVTGDGAVGIRTAVETSGAIQASRIRLVDGGGSSSSLVVDGDGARGIVVEGQLDGPIGGQTNARGIEIGAGSTIQVNGDDAIGISVADRETPLSGLPSGEIDGSVSVTGANGTALSLGRGYRFEIGGSLSAPGLDGVGALVPDFAVLVVQGTVVGGSGGGAAVRAVDPAAAGDGSFLLLSAGATLDGSASGVAFEGGSGDDELLIGGADPEAVAPLPGALVSGAVLLGDGNDRVAVGPGGSFDSSLDGGTGADELLLGNISDGSDLSGAPGTGSLDLDGVLDFETLILEAPGSTFTLSGSAAFSNGVELRAGTLAGALTLDGSDDQVEISPDATLAGTLDTAGGDDTVTLQGFGRGSLDASRLLNTETLRVASGVWGVSGTGSFDQVALDGGVLAPQGTLTIQGDVLHTSTGILGTELVSPAVSNELVVDGTLTLQDGATIQVVDLSPEPLDGRFRILQATTLVGLDTARTLLPEDTTRRSYDLLFEAATNELFVIAGSSSFSTVGNTAGRRRTGRYLDRIDAAGPSPELASVLGLVDVADLSLSRKRIDDLSPEIYDAHAETLALQSRAFAEVLRAPVVPCTVYRYRYQDETRTSPSACGTGGWNPWAVPFHWSLDRSGQRGRPGYDVLGAGIAAGVDWRPAPNLRVNLGVGGGRSGIELDPGFNASAAGFEAGAEARWRRGALQVAGLFTYGHAWHDTSRNLSNLDRNARSDHESNWLSLRGEARYGLLFGAVEVAPVLRLDYTGLFEQDANETGAGDVSLQVEERENHLFVSSLGLEVNAELATRRYLNRYFQWTDGIWRPMAYVRWRETWHDADRDVEARFADAPAGTGRFEVEADGPERGAEVGARLGFQPEQVGGEFAIAYDFFTGSQTEEHQLRLEIRIPLP